MTATTQAYRAALAGLTASLPGQYRPIGEIDQSPERILSLKERQLRHWCQVCETNTEACKRMGWAVTSSGSSPFVRRCREWKIETPAQRNKRRKREQIQVQLGL